MSNFDSAISVCRHCQSYHLEGRRGGFCMQLGTPVQGCWKACSYAVPPFAPSWEVSTGINNHLAQSLWQRSQDHAELALAPMPGQTTHQATHQPTYQATIEVVRSCVSDSRTDDELYAETDAAVTTFSVRAS